VELLVLKSHDPAFNLACEEYALKELKLELLMLWRNSPAIIIGKNQNALAEVDLDYTAAHSIPVIRRLSGGGAVFHDLGNINYTIINRLREDDFSNYARFTAPLRDFLKHKGLQAELNGRNDLVIDDMKFSGNAQTVSGEWILSHGCLLFSADLSRMAGALRPRPAKIKSHGVESIRSRVTNLADHLPSALSADGFFSELADWFAQSCAGTFELCTRDLERIEQLRAEKYLAWEWNIGASPDYSYYREKRFDSGTVELGLEVQDGMIRRVGISGDFFGMADVGELESALCEVPHRREALWAALTRLDVPRYIYSVSAEELLELLC
jgi:lipoate-protein ligase A